MVRWAGCEPVDRREFLTWIPTLLVFICLGELQLLMGWPTTRYVEGIDALYGTNRFHFSGTVLMKNLAQLLRPEHLALIRSAEMIWNLGQVARPPSPDMDLSSDERFAGWYTFASLLQAVPDALPNLQYLHVTLSGTWYPDQMAPNDILRRSVADVLEPVDQMVKDYFSSNSRLKEVNVGLPYKIWIPREKHDARASSRVEMSSFKDVPARIWRSLGCSEEIPGREAEEIGYWTRCAVVPEGKRSTSRAIRYILCVMVE